MPIDILPVPTQPVSIAGNQAVNNAQIAGNTISTGTGVSGTGTQRVAIASDGLPALVAGTANIGDVDIVTQPARARTVDHVGAAAMTDAVMNGITVLTPKFAKIAHATSGNNTLVSAVSGKKIRVLALFLVAAGAVNAYFVDSAGTPVALAGDATNKIALTTNSGFTLPFNPVGWFETSTTNVNLNLNLSAAVAVAGALSYVEV